MTNQNSTNQNLEPVDLQNDPIIKRLFDNVPDEVIETFTNDQLLEIRTLFINKINNSSDVDIRLSIPFLRRRFYLVFLMGKERRSLQRLKQSKFKVINPFISTISIVSTFCLVLMANLYIMQNYDKINVFTYSPLEKLIDSWQE